MSGYIGPQPVPQATQHRESFTATSGQTSFATAGYTPQFLDVYLNGVHLLDGTDYTATNGSDVVLTTGAATDDILEVVSYTPFEVADQTFTGTTTVTDSGAAPLVANRTTSDGDIQVFQKDGSTVGSIGTDSGFTYYTGGSGSGVKMKNSAVVPTNGSGVNADGTESLGQAAVRWNNLYLSGGVYLGGTGSANHLDDYEEGTWTVGFSGATISATNTTGHYTKIGRVVYYSYYSQASNISGASGTPTITGLPFTVSNSVTFYQPFYTSHNTFFGGSTSNGVEGYASTATTQLRFTTRGTAADAPGFVNSGSAYLMIAGFYITDE